MALFLGFFFMVIMKACAACITWTAILLVEVLCAALTYYMYDESLKKQEEIDKLPAGSEVPTNYHQYIFYVMAVMFLVLTCVILCYYNKIRIAIKIM